MARSIPRSYVVMHSSPQEPSHHHPSSTRRLPALQAFRSFPKTALFLVLDSNTSIRLSFLNQIKKYHVFIFVAAPPTPAPHTRARSGALNDSGNPIRVPLDRKRCADWCRGVPPGKHQGRQGYSDRRWVLSGDGPAGKVSLPAVVDACFLFCRVSYFIPGMMLCALVQVQHLSGAEFCSSLTPNGA